MDFTLPANVQDAVTRQRIAIYVCPSEMRDEMKPASSSSGPGAINRWPTTYAANVGTWMVWDPNTGRGGDGALPFMGGGETETHGEFRPLKWTSNFPVMFNV